MIDYSGRSYREIDDILGKYSFEQKLELVRSNVSKCKQCSWSCECLASMGNTSASLFIVDSAPGYLKVEFSTWVVPDTSTNRILVKMVDCLGFSLYNSFISYTHGCHRPRVSGEKSISRDLSSQMPCSFWVGYNLHLFRWNSDLNTILLLGNDAVRLFGLRKEYPSEQSFIFEDKLYRVMVMWHPWYLAKNPNSIPYKKTMLFLRGQERLWL